MHIVIAPDKFKGSLTAMEAAEAIRKGLSSVFTSCSYTLLPLADGGEGIIDAFSRSAGVHHELRPVTARDALGRDVETEFLLLHMPVSTAVIESSHANGLWRIAADERDLSRASSYGVGQLVRAAAESGAGKIVIGIGGSATNDAGLGLAAALGHRFLDVSGKELEPIPANLQYIESIDSTAAPSLPPLTVACDVENPLLGPRGATRVYGLQKGLLPGQTEAAENALSRFASIVNAHFNADFTDTPGAGAAGGLGYGLMAFCGATLESGFDCIANALGAEEKIATTDLVFTAEGSLDQQTLEGKTPHGVSRIARRHGIPVYAFAGRLADEDQLHEHFNGIASIVNSPMTLEEAIANAHTLLEKAAGRLAHTILNSRLPSNPSHFPTHRAAECSPSLPPSGQAGSSSLITLPAGNLSST